MNKFKKNLFLFLPMIVAISLVAGLYLGKKMNQRPLGSDLFFANKNFTLSDKLREVIQFIESDYVDTIKEEMLVEGAINELLQNLDPHSFYIPKEQYAAVNDPLEGNFEGIGIEFRIQQDTVIVVQPIGGGPSEKVGIMAGDRIVVVEGDDITGEKLNNQLVINLLKGPKGSEVSLKVKRTGEKNLLDFTVIRDEIPLHSVEATYTVDNIGYIKIVRFSKTTYEEFMSAAYELKEKGIKGMIVDLRNNGGGYLLSATKIADEFLKDGKLIVYTEGKSRERQEFYATSDGILEDMEVVILINEGSASASEILAGAIQDNDRGEIIGRRSFGKGLVQEGIQWPDGSAMRLTVARYYTPVGRSIQKPFDNGVRAYQNEAYQRFDEGELFSPDSIHFIDSLQYLTPGGDTVYGGGGIMPDIFIPIDTEGTSHYFGRLNYSGVFYLYGFHYVDSHRESLKNKFTESSFNEDFTINEEILSDFYAYAEKKRIEFDQEGANTSLDLIKKMIKATIGRNVWGETIFYKIINQEDATFQRAVEELKLATDQVVLK